MYKRSITILTLVFSLGLISCAPSEEKKDEAIPEVKQEQVDSLLDNASKMIETTSDSLNKSTEEKK